MKFKISEGIITKYPDLKIGAVIAKGVSNIKYNEKIQDIIKTLIEEKRQQIDPEKIAEIPIIAKWRGIYKSFGAKPGNYRNSAESLLKRILKKELYKINPLVDIYNYISIRYTMTVGGEDLDSIEGDLVLGFAKGKEEFIPLGEEENNPPWEGEVVYKDDKGIVCRCWNWREGDRTKLTANTKNAIVVIENPIPENDKKLNEALIELKELISKYCGGEGKIIILGKDNPSVEL